MNSVNAKQGSLDAVLPIVKEHRAAVAGLMMDETGIPSQPAQRRAIAQRMPDRHTINTAFLPIMITYGVTCPMVDAMIPQTRKAILATDVFLGRDRHALTRQRRPLTVGARRVDFIEGSPGHLFGISAGTG